MTKWANVRDAFMRSLRTKSGQAATKSYIYGEHLQFLLKVAQKDTTYSNFRPNELTHNELSSDSEILGSSAPSGSAKKQIRSMSLSSPALTASDSEKPGPSQPGLSLPAKKVCRSKRELNNLEEEILSELKKSQAAGQSTVRSDHETLLLSFLPYIRDLNETEMMDFQMETLTTIRKIKQKRVLNTTLYPGPARSFVRIRSPSGQNVQSTIAHHSPSPVLPATKYTNSPYQSPEQTTNINHPSPLANASGCTSPYQHPDQEREQNIYQTLFDNCGVDDQS